MTDQSTIFDQNTPPTDTPVVPAVQPNGTSDKEGKPTTPESVDVNAVFADQLSAIRNEEGSQKYQSVQDALLALKASQDHIKRIEAENAQYKTMDLKAKTTEEILELLDSNKRGEGDSQNQIDLETIKGLVKSTLTETEQVKLATANQQTVLSALVSTFGDKAEETYMAKAQELGVPVHVLDSLASTSPKAVLAYFNTKGAVVTKNNQGSVSTESFKGNPSPTSPNIMFGASKNQIMDLWRETSSTVATEK